MSQDPPPYVKPDWFTSRVLNPLLMRFGRVPGLAVRGRTSGRWRTVPVNVLELDGQRYLVAPRGETQWARNLRATGRGEIRWRSRTEACGFAASSTSRSYRAAVGGRRRRRSLRASGGLPWPHWGPHRTGILSSGRSERRAAARTPPRAALDREGAGPGCALSRRDQRQAQAALEAYESRSSRICMISKARPPGERKKASLRRPKPALISRGSTRTWAPSALMR